MADQKISQLPTISSIQQADIFPLVDSGSTVSVTFSNLVAAIAARQIVGEVVIFSGTSGSLANTPLLGTVKLYRGGSRQQSGAGNDYTISTAAITLATAAASGEVFLADYTY